MIDTTHVPLMHTTHVPLVAQHMLYGVFPGRMTILGAASQGGGQPGMHAETQEEQCDLVVLEDMSAQGVEELRSMRRRALARSALVFATFPQAQAWRALNLSSPQVVASASMCRARDLGACVYRAWRCRGHDALAHHALAHHVQAAGWGTAVEQGLLKPLACFSPSARLLPTPHAAAGGGVAGRGGRERNEGKVSVVGHGGAGGWHAGMPPVGVPELET